MELNLKYGEVFKQTTKALDSGFDVVIHKGGTGSGKTYELMLMLLFSRAMIVPNEIITIVSESHPHLKIGTIRYLDKFISDYNLHHVIKVNQSDKTYLFPNGTIIEFFSADRIGKALGARRDILYGNEIDTLKQKIWEELARRSKIILGDFNPTAQFWLEDWLQYYPNHIIIKSNYLSNVALPQHEIDRIQRRAELDANFKRIHIDCEYGNSEGLVFLPEKIILIDEFPKDLKHTYGMDFGWTAPSTLIKTASTEEAIYIDEIFYQPGMSEKDFETKLKPIDKRDKINADSEDQRMINYLRMNLKYNVFAAKKPKGSVEFGIGYLQSRIIYITKRSLKTIHEFRNLMNATDSEGRTIRGKYTGEDHAIDAARYSLEDNMKPKSSFGGLTY